MLPSGEKLFWSLLRNGWVLFRWRQCGLCRLQVGLADPSERKGYQNPTKSLHLISFSATSRSPRWQTWLSTSHPLVNDPTAKSAAELGKDRLHIGHLYPIILAPYGLRAQSEKPRCLPFFPNGQQDAVSAMLKRDSAKALSVFHCRPRCVAPFDLNKNYFKGVSAFCPSRRRSVILANCDEVNHPSRFASAWPGKAHKMPSRKRRVRNRLTDTHFCHRDRPTLGIRRSCESLFVVDFFHPNFGLTPCLLSRDRAAYSNAWQPSTPCIENNSSNGIQEHIQLQFVRRITFSSLYERSWRRHRVECVRCG
jgi:hypothetical protein